jgi:hypothetical protein
MRSAFRSSRASAFVSICDLVLFGVFAMGGCVEDEVPPQRDPVEMPVPDEPTGARRVTVTHSIAPTLLAPAQERTACYSWTLDNDAPLYVDTVAFANLGAFHHSNWFVVPEDAYPGDDGMWDCTDRRFDAFAAAQAGTVLFAQSTQAWDERMDLANGAVIRIPERSKIVGDLHLLNLAPSAAETAAWLSLDLVHPWDVETVLVPLQLTYLDLEIPAKGKARFTAACPSLETAGNPLDIYYVLPHFHSTGDYFELWIENDETSSRRPLVLLEGFGADAIGQTFDPPVLKRATERLHFTCGYDNWYSEPLKWGIGIDEMCVVLALVDAVDVSSSVVLENDGFFGVQDGVAVNTGACETFTVPKGLAYALPTPEELGAPLYVPGNVDAVDGPPPGPTCVDADLAAQPLATPTLDNLRTHVFEPSCNFSACHGDAQAGGLHLTVAGLREALLTHEVRAATDLPLVSPGDPDGSWLYRVLSRCDPGAGAAHMPRNAPVLLSDETIALVAAWIQAGAEGE